MNLKLFGDYCTILLFCGYILMPTDAKFIKGKQRCVRHGKRELSRDDVITSNRYVITPTRNVFKKTNEKPVKRIYVKIIVSDPDKLASTQNRGDGQKSQFYDVVNGISYSQSKTRRKVNRRRMKRRGCQTFRYKPSKLTKAYFS